MKNTKLYKFLFEEEEAGLMANIEPKKEGEGEEKIMGPPETKSSEPTIDSIPSTVTMAATSTEPTP